LFLIIFYLAGGKKQEAPFASFLSVLHYTSEGLATGGSTCKETKERCFRRRRNFSGDVDVIEKAGEKSHQP